MKWVAHTPPPVAVADRMLARIAAETDAIISLGAGGHPAEPLEASLAFPLQVKPELCTLSLPAAPDRAKGRAEDAAAAPGSPLAGAALDEIRLILARFAAVPGTRFAFECHEVGQLHALRRLVDDGLVEGPLFLQYGLGAWRGAGSDPESLPVLRATADRLFGRDNHEFAAFGAGRQQMSVVTLSAIMGGHVRVGVEDGPHVSRGPSAMSCSAQVLKVRRILDELSIAIASPAEAREILRTRGAARGIPDV